MAGNPELLRKSGGPAHRLRHRGRRPGDVPACWRSHVPLAGLLWSTTKTVDQMWEDHWPWQKKPTAMPARTETLMTNPRSHPAGASEAHCGQSLRATGIRDVAAAAGVSTATVSRALRGLPRVSQSTRQKILTAAADLGYVASSAASELARARGTRKATLPEQLQRVEPPASNTARCSPSGPFEMSDHAASPSRGTILVVHALTGPARPDEHLAPTQAEIEQFIQSVASAHGFTACMMFCNEAGMMDAVRAAAAQSVGIVINTGGFSPASPGLDDTLASASVPTVEVRLNNIAQFSAFTAAISGAGIYGYKLAIDYLSTIVQPGRGLPG